MNNETNNYFASYYQNKSRHIDNHRLQTVMSTDECILAEEKSNNQHVQVQLMNRKISENSEKKHKIQCAEDEKGQ